MAALRRDHGRLARIGDSGCDGVPVGADLRRRVSAVSGEPVAVCIPVAIPASPHERARARFVHGVSVRPGERISIVDPSQAHLGRRAVCSGRDPPPRHLRPRQGPLRLRLLRHRVHLPSLLSSHLGTLPPGRPLHPAGRRVRGLAQPAVASLRGWTSEGAGGRPRWTLHLRSDPGPRRDVAERPEAPVAIDGRSLESVCGGVADLGGSRRCVPRLPRPVDGARRFRPGAVSRPCAARSPPRAVPGRGRPALRLRRPHHGHHDKRLEAERKPVPHDVREPRDKLRTQSARQFVLG